MLNFNNIHISHGYDSEINWKGKIIPKGEIVISTINDKIDAIYIGQGVVFEETPSIKLSTSADIQKLQEQVKEHSNLLMLANKDDALESL